MIAEIELGNRFSVLPRADTNRNLMSLLLVCANLTFLLCCNRLFVNQALQLRIARPSVMAAPSPPRLLAAWRVEAFFFFAVFLFLVALVTRILFVKTWLDRSQSKLQGTGLGAPQSLPFQLHDVLARGTHVPQVAACSTRRTHSA